MPQKNELSMRKSVVQSAAESAEDAERGFHSRQSSGPRRKSRLVKRAQKDKPITGMGGMGVTGIAGKGMF